jgi:hypothetical protein
MSINSNLSTECFEAGVRWAGDHKNATTEERKAAAAKSADPEAFLDGIHDEIENRTQMMHDEWQMEALYGKDD